jgi:hypothetical protein
LQWSKIVHLGICYPIHTKDHTDLNYIYTYDPAKIYKDIDMTVEGNLILSTHGLDYKYCELYKDELFSYPHNLHPAVAQYDNWYTIDSRVDKVIYLGLLPNYNHSLFSIWNVIQRDHNTIVPEKIYNYYIQKNNQYIEQYTDYLEKIKLISKLKIIKTEFVSMVDNDFDRFKNIFIKLFKQVNLIKLNELFEEYQNKKINPYKDFIEYINNNNLFDSFKINIINHNYHVIS